MTDLELQQYSLEQKSTATEIMSKSDLMTILSKYGECSVVGSYSYDLMYGPDIDIVVITKNPREMSVKTIKELIDARQFQKYQYGDFEKFPKVGRPDSFIIVLISEVNGVKWETEIWFHKQYPEGVLVTDALIRDKLDAESKLAILKLKEERSRNGDNKHHVSSVDIYKAVLVDGITEYKKILK